MWWSNEGEGDMRKPPSNVADFEDGIIEPRPKEYRWPLDARKG